MGKLNWRKKQSKYSWVWTGVGDMDYPRNPSAPKQVLVENRPNPQNVYTPGFTIEGGKSGLTRSEYQEAIRNHSPLASRCLNKVRWHLLSLVAVSGIGGRFYAKRTSSGFLTPCLHISKCYRILFDSILQLLTLLPIYSSWSRPRMAVTSDYLLFSRYVLSGLYGSNFLPYFVF